MSVTDDKLLLLKSHECSTRLSQEALEEISQATELVQYESGEYVHHSEDRLESVYFVVHGRLKQIVVDFHGNALFQRIITRGAQFGTLGAAQSDPVPVDVIALEPSALLKLDFATTLAFTRKYEQFGLNLTRSISAMVRQVLLEDRIPKQPSVVTLFHESPESRSLTSRLVQRLKELGESPCVLGDHSNLDGLEKGNFRNLVSEGNVISREEIRRQLNLWSETGRIIVDIDANLKPETAALLIEFSEQVIWCTHRDRSDASFRRLKSIVALSPGWRDKINLVWMLSDNEQVAPLAPQLDALFDRDFKIFESKLQPGQGRTLLDGFERLVHQLRGVRIGLALGGGGARGMAHLGVLKAFEEHGIIVDMIAGTSVGAMTGILYSAGFGASYLTDRFSEDLKPSRLFRMLPHGNDWYLLSKYRRNQFNRMLRKYLVDWRLEQLPVPVESVTVDLVVGEPIVRQRGDATNCILESINLPGLSRPICRAGQALVDGGLVNNIPADVLVRNGCNFVIAVSVTAKLNPEFANNRPETPTSGMKLPSIMQTVLRSYLVQSVNMNSVGVQPADIVIEPDVAGVELSNFSLTPQLAARGEEAAVEAIPSIKSLLSQLDPALFPSQSPLSNASIPATDSGGKKD